MRPTRPRRPRGSMRGSPLFRLRFGFVVIAMVLSIFGARLVQLQGVDPNAYAEMAAAEGMVEVDLPARRGDILDRNGEPLAASIDGLMVVADPLLTADQAPELAKFLAQRLDVDYFTILPRLREEGSRFEYIARRVPSTLATEVVEEADEAGFEGLDTRQDPVRDYPAGDVAANMIGFVGTDEALGGFERTFDARLAGKDGTARYAVGGGNRIPLGESTIVAAHQRHRPAHHPRPRPPVVRPTGAAPDRGGRACRLRLRGRPAHGDGRDHGPGRPPDVRRLRPAAVAGGGPGVPRHERRLRAGLGGEGADPERPHRLRRGHPADQDRGAAGAAPRRTRHRRLVPARPDQADPRRGARQVLQHRHGPRLRPVRAGRAAQVPREVRAREADRHRGARRDAGHPPGPEPVDRPGQGPGRVRPVGVGQRGADGRGDQHRRERRAACGPEPHPGRGQDRRRHRRRHRHHPDPPGDRAAGRRTRPP